MPSDCADAGRWAMKGDGYSGLPKWTWFVVPIFLWEVYSTISYGAWDVTPGDQVINVGSSIAGVGVAGVIAAFVVHDWFLALRDWLSLRGTWMDHDAMQRNPSHPDWVRAYQKKPRVQR